MRSEFVWVCLAAFLVGVVVCDNAGATEDVAAMSKDELVAALTNARQESTKLNKKLTHAGKKISSLKHELRVATGDDEASELQRQKNERKSKAAEKKQEQDKKNAQLKKKSKLSDILMEHGAKYLAMKAAEKNADSGDVKQKKAVMAAAKKGGRAGAVGPLTKVIRAAAVAAIKKSRAESKKKGIHDKHAMRKLSVAAAKVAVNKMMKEQDEQLEKIAKKWTAHAVEKFPPSAVLADDDDTPNNFVAPPSIHLSLGGADAGQVEQLKEDAAKTASHEKPAKESAPSTIHLSLTDDKKADAIVPEK
jgi:hypothetical protein